MGMGGNRIIGDLPLVVDVGKGGDKGVPYVLSGGGRLIEAEADPGMMCKTATQSVAENVWGAIKIR